jgi:hypothetical protein
LKGISHGIIKVITWYLPGGTEENHEKTVLMANVLAKIETSYLPNSNLEFYLLGWPI